jgi:hypothetical protein
VHQLLLAFQLLHRLPCPGPHPSTLHTPACHLQSTTPSRHRPRTKDTMCTNVCFIQSPSFSGFSLSVPISQAMCVSLFAILFKFSSALCHCLPQCFCDCPSLRPCLTHIAVQVTHKHTRFTLPPPPPRPPILCALAFPLVLTSRRSTLGSLE